MKSLRMPTWLVHAVRSWLPFVSRKQPWYRRNPAAALPRWLPVVLIAPFVLFLLWKLSERRYAAVAPDTE